MWGLLPEIDREHRRVVLAAMVGTTIEWYDFFIYALCAPLVFATQYFAALGSQALLVSFATIGISFVFRPLGAVLAGQLGDRIGRKAMLIGTLLLMGIATVLMGLLPSAASIGTSAPVLLVLLRVLQGISAGGEWGGAALIAVEHAPAGRRGLYGAFPQIGTPIGLLLANGVLALIVGLTSPAAFVAWGWRIAFLLSVLLIVLGVLVRTRVAESPVFTQARASGGASVPFGALLRQRGRLVLLGALLFAANNAVGYMTTGGYVQSYAVKTLRMNPTTVLSSVLVAAFVWLLSTLAAGALADRYGRIRVYQVGFVIQLVWMIPFFALLDTGATGALLLGLVCYAVGLGLTYGPQSALYTEMFPTQLRYRGAAIAYALGSVLGGAFAPTIAQALRTSTGTVYSIGGYLAGMTVLGLVVSFFIPDHPGRPLNAPDLDAPELNAPGLGRPDPAPPA